MLQYLLPVMRPVALRQYAGPSPWPSLADPDDEPIWATAVTGEAQFVVSDNTTDFPPLIEVGKPSDTRSAHVYNEIEYLTAIEFIEGVLEIDAREVYGHDLPRSPRRSGRSRHPVLKKDN